MAMFEIHAVDEQIKALPTVSTASGSIATFDTDMTENLVEVKCQILAQQSGSGTPSPSNPRPIQTYSEMNVSACGDNLFLPRIQSINGITTAYNANGEITLNGTATAVSYPVNIDAVPYEAGTYTISVSGLTTGISFSYTKNGSWAGSPTTSVTFTLTEKSTIGGYISVTNGTNTDGVVITIKLEKGNMPTAFTPFGTKYNIPFGQTVAQGLLNVTTGKLRVTHGIVDLGSLAWNYYQYGGLNGGYSDSLYADIKHPTSSTEVANAISSGFVIKSDNYFDTNSAYGQLSVSIYGRIKLNIDGVSDSATLKTALSGIQLVYELATPIEIQLDSITLQALLNENNIWCDTGDTEVKYLLTVGKAIS